MIWEFFVLGHPAPGGSKRAFVPRRRDGSFVFRKGTNSPIVNITDAGGEANKQWRKAVAVCGRNFMLGSKPFELPFRVEFIFFLQRPLAHYVANDRTRELKPDAPPYHVGPPDSLKLARSTEDALTGVLWKDDAQTVRICSEKRWCNIGDKPGCTVKVVPITIDEPQQRLL